MTIVVHHLEFSRSLRILWLMEELGLQYEIKRYARTREFRSPPELYAVHPLGRAPVVEVDGHVLAESGAILEYFVEREGKLRPEAGQALLDYRFFLHYAEGSTMPPLLVHLITTQIESAPVPFFAKPIAKRIATAVRENFSDAAIETHFDFVNLTLSKQRYFAGSEFSAADIQMYYAAEAALRRGSGRWTNLLRWRDEVMLRPAYVLAESKGGTALPEETMGH